MHQVRVAPISESEGCGLVAREDLKPGETVLRVPLSCCLHVEAVRVSLGLVDRSINVGRGPHICVHTMPNSFPPPPPQQIHIHTTTTPKKQKKQQVDKSVLAPLVQAEPDLIASLPDDELLALLLMAERRAGKASFWWPYLRCVWVGTK
jgi:hypothetical protein